MSRHNQAHAIGDCWTRYWDYKEAGGTYRHVPDRPNYREYVVVTKTGEGKDSYGYLVDTYDVLDEDQIANAELTIKNSSVNSRHEQAKILKARGYFGPVGGGEARALRNLFTELGKADLVKHGWSYNKVEVNRYPSKYLLRRALRRGIAPPPVRREWTTKLQNCYVFKSPMDNVPFEKFVKLARMYKDDSGKLRTAVLAVLANPDAHKEVEAADVLDILGNMTEAL